MKRFIIAAVAVAGLICAEPALAQKVWGDPEDPVYGYADSDASMNAAMEEARRTYPQFLAAFRADTTANRAQYYMVKVGLDTAGGTVEHIWVGDLFIEEGRLYGALANIPADLPGMGQGSRIEVDAGRISDWSLTTADGMYGNFTTRVMVDDLPSAERAEYRAMLTPDPIPASWQP